MFNNALCIRGLSIKYDSRDNRSERICVFQSPVTAGAPVSPSTDSSWLMQLSLVVVTNARLRSTSRPKNSLTIHDSLIHAWLHMS